MRLLQSRDSKANKLQTGSLLMNSKLIKIGKLQMGGNKLITLIAGPCAMESEKIVMNTAEKLKMISEDLGLPLIFKSSFDKANRTSISSYRGLGIELGLQLLRKVKEEFHIPVTTDIHLPEQALMVAEVVDLIQIPAFLCRQTDIILAAAKTNKPVNIKKGQFLAPWDMKNVVKKLVTYNNDNVILTERGTCFGYNNLVVDMTGLVEMKKLGYPIVFDATHSVQKPGANGQQSGGNRNHVRYLARAAAAIGLDGLFMEVHPDPDNALSDGANMIKLSELKNILVEIKQIDILVKAMN